MRRTLVSWFLLCSTIVGTSCTNNTSSPAVGTNNGSGASVPSAAQPTSSAPSTTTPATATPQANSEVDCTTIGQRLLEVSAERVSDPQLRLGRLTSFVGLVPGTTEDEFVTSGTNYRSCAKKIYDTFNEQASSRLAAVKAEGIKQGALDAAGTFAYHGNATVGPERAEPAKFKTMMSLLDKANTEDAELIKQLDSKVSAECGTDPATKAVRMSLVRGELKMEPISIVSVKVQLLQPWKMYGNFGRDKGDHDIEAYQEIAPSKLETDESVVAAPMIDDATTKNQLVCKLQFSMEGSLLPIPGKGSWNKETSEIAFVPDRPR